MLHNKVSTFKKELFNHVGVFSTIDQKWDGQFIDLSDDAKDVVCYLWLTVFDTWHNDVFPAAVKNPINTLSLLYTNNGVDFKAAIEKDILHDVMKYRHQAAQNGEVFMASLYMDDLWYSPATDYFSEAFSTSDNAEFADWYKCSIYLYLESHLSDIIQEVYDDYVGGDE